MAVLYATFAGFDEHQRRRGVECSCFGASAAPATAGHVAMNVAAGIAATVSPATSLATTIGEDGAVGLLSVLLLATATAALTLTLTAASELADAVSKVWPRGGT